MPSYITMYRRPTITSSGTIFPDPPVHYLGITECKPELDTYPTKKGKFNANLKSQAGEWPSTDHTEECESSLT